MTDAFADLLEANAAHAATVGDPLPGRAARTLAVVACMDPRVDPLAALGLSVGDAVVLRNPGARVTDEVLRALVLARHLLGVDRVAVVAHTSCRMAAASEDAVHDAVRAAGGPDTRSLSFLTAADQHAELLRDLQRIGSSPYLEGVTAAGFVYDLASGRLEPTG